MIHQDSKDNQYGFEFYLSNTVGVSDKERELLVAGLHRERFKKGSTLLKSGELCRHSFFVEKGLLRAYMLDDLGKEHLIQFAPENWFIVDRSSVYFNDPSDSFIEAIEDTEVVFIDEGFMARAASLSITF